MLLAIDTATATASAAIYDLRTEQTLGELTWQARRRQTQDLLPSVEHLLQLTGVTPAELDALAVTTGPGSFTGVRIGISVVKGIGMGLPVSPKVVGIPTLSVAAAPWLGAAASCSTPVSICACIQAGRGRYNWAWFEAGSRLQRPGVGDHHVGTVEEFAATLAESTTKNVWLTGEIDPALVDAASSLEHVAVMDPCTTWRRAGVLACIAAQHLAADDTDQLESLQPIYLRNP